MTKAEDLAELGLADNEDVDERTIRKAYLRLSRSRHPDKGGTKESFQLLVNAYERLRSDTYAANVEEKEEDQGGGCGGGGGEYDEGFWYDAHHDFFQRAWEYGWADDAPEFENYHENWHESAKERARRRREDIRAGYDWRDRKAKASDEKCMFCGVNAPITKRKAKAEGLNWEEYSAHPDGLKTCWVCKDKHISVMTENMAIKKFGKKLDYMVTSSRTGTEYRPVFWFLKCKGRSFHHQPKTNYCEVPTRNSEYYWYPDLETEALSLGWKPRGKQKEEVPWTRKDKSSALVAHMKPSPTPKKRKAQDNRKMKAIVTPEKKQRGK